MSLEIIFFQEKLFNFVFFSFLVYLLPGFIIERSHDTLSVFEEGAFEHILRAKV